MHTTDENQSIRLHAGLLAYGLHIRMAHAKLAKASISEILKIGAQWIAERDFRTPDMPSPRNTSGLTHAHRDAYSEIMTERNLKAYYCRMMDGASERGEIYEVPEIHEHIFFSRVPLYVAPARKDGGLFGFIHRQQERVGI